MLKINDIFISSLAILLFFVVAFIWVDFINNDIYEYKAYIDDEIVEFFDKYEIVGRDGENCYILREKQIRNYI